MLTAHQVNQQKKYDDFRASILKESPTPCNLEVGDYVTFTNDYGVFFRRPRQVIGFDFADDSNRFIYTEGDAYWFPSSPEQLHKVEKTPTGCLLVRELTFLPMYEFENQLYEQQGWCRLVIESSLHCV